MNLHLILGQHGISTRFHTLAPGEPCVRGYNFGLWRIGAHGGAINRPTNNPIQPQNECWYLGRRLCLRT